MTCFKTCWGEMQCVRSQRYLLVWLINLTYRQAVSYVGTRISEGDHSLGKLRSLLYHREDGS